MMNHPWLPNTIKFLEHGCCSESEVECMKALAERFYNKPDGIIYIGEVIQYITELESTIGIEWVWFTGGVACNTPQRAFTMMKLITRGGFDSPPIGEMVLIDLNTDPHEIIEGNDMRQVFGNSERENHTTCGFKHTEHLKTETMDVL